MRLDDGSSPYNIAGDSLEFVAPLFQTLISLRLDLELFVDGGYNRELQAVKARDDVNARLEVDETFPTTARMGVVTESWAKETEDNIRAARRTRAKKSRRSTVGTFFLENEPPLLP